MIKKFKDFAINEYNSMPTSTTDMLQPDANMDATMADATATEEFDQEVSGKPQPKIIDSVIELSISEIQDLLFDAHQRVKSNSYGETIKEIRSEDGHVVKIVLAADSE